MSDVVVRSLLRGVVAHVRQVLFVPPRDQLRPLNGLRGLGSIMITSFHCAIFTGLFPLTTGAKAALNWFQYSINGFWVALDIFFVLSGFLIGRILLTNLVRHGTLRSRSFYTRRFFRIFPAYYLVLTLGLFWYTRLGLPVVKFIMGDVGSGWRAVQGGGWKNYVYLSNYLIPPGRPNIMTWGWSLCLEEHFYLMLPPLLWLIFRCRKTAVRCALLVAAGLLPLVGRAVQYAVNPRIVLMEGFYYYSHNRFDEVFVGVVIAFFYVVDHARLRAFCERVGHGLWIAAALLIGFVWLYGGLQETGCFAVVWQFSIMALGAGLLVLNCLFLPNRVTRFFAHGFWYPFARTSYGTYLIHPFVLLWLVDRFGSTAPTHRIGPGSFVIVYLAVMAITQLIAFVMFVLLERPLIDTGVRLTRERPATLGERLEPVRMSG